MKSIYCSTYYKTDHYTRFADVFREKIKQYAAPRLEIIGGQPRTPDQLSTRIRTCSWNDCIQNGRPEMRHKETQHLENFMDRRTAIMKTDSPLTGNTCRDLVTVVAGAQEQRNPRHQHLNEEKVYLQVNPFPSWLMRLRCVHANLGRERQ